MATLTSFALPRAVRLEVYLLYLLFPFRNAKCFATSVVMLRPRSYWEGAGCHMYDPFREQRYSG